MKPVGLLEKAMRVQKRVKKGETGPTNASARSSNQSAKSEGGAFAGEADEILSILTLVEHRGTSLLHFSGKLDWSMVMMFHVGRNVANCG